MKHRLKRSSCRGIVRRSYRLFLGIVLGRYITKYFTMKAQLQQTFQQWLKEITWGDLKDALWFELDKAEQELFLEMVRLQAPPPTPIHPRAIPYARCQSDATDGRDPVQKRQRDIRFRQRWFRFVDHGRGKVTVQARNFEGDASGRYLQRLTMGCTREQIDLDRAIQHATVACIGRHGSLTCHYILRPENNRHDDETAQKQAFLRVLKVASRGRFASMALSAGAAWLEPTKRWFPLSMYLASRFELSLWRAYRSGLCAFSNDNPLLLRWTDGLQSSTVCMAVREASKEMLSEIDSSRLMDGLLYRLLECGSLHTTDKPGPDASHKSLLRTICLIDLSDMADCHIFRLKRSVCDKLHELAAARTAQALLDELDQAAGTETETRARTKKKKSRKRRNGNAVIGGGIVDEFAATTGAPSNSPVMTKVSSSIRSADEMETAPNNNDISSDKLEYTTIASEVVRGPDYLLYQDSRLGQVAIPIVPYDAALQLSYAPEPGQVSSSPSVLSRSDHPDGMVWEVSDAALDDWGRVQGFATREQSVFAELFPSQAALSQEHTPSSATVSQQVDQQSPAAASEANAAMEDPLPCRDPESQSATTDLPSKDAASMGMIADTGEEAASRSGRSSIPPATTTGASEAGKPPAVRGRLSSNMSREDLRSVAESSNERKFAVKVARSTSYRTMGAKLLRARDDHDIQRQQKSIDGLSSFRLVLVKNTPSKAKDDHDIRGYITAVGKTGVRSISSPSRRCVVALPTIRTAPTNKLSRHVSGPPSHVDVLDPPQICARSETLEGDTDWEHWNDRLNNSLDGDNNATTMKDETTTITSAPSHHESEEMSRLKEERNSYRDLCLTLGAEVAKLTNILASQRISNIGGHMIGMSHGAYQPNLAEPIFDPQSVDRGYVARHGRTFAAMSDAGHRAEHESLASEETGALVRQSGVVGDSDWSVDQASAAIQSTQFQLPSFITRTKGMSDPVSLNGMQSRLALDIMQFVDSTSTQLRKQGPTRQGAVERMIRLVNTLWPRAQVKLYGSHVTGVCLPSSDVDFIICLPAVHKKAVAVAPGVLEGRNAINESSQKQLYRRLKAETWIDPRSIKLIERTIVPVIKVTTKDTKARTIQLDITFDAPGHHGLEAVDLVTQMIAELPMIRPLVLVLKQFLINRSLLTAYTGGLSSYCLFLMVARYLQEQPSVYGDVGALLIGFLDFFGNHFDPRTTGLSVRRRQYFPRPNYSASRFQPSPPAASHAPPAWNHGVFTGQGPGSTQFYRRNSFSDKGSGEMAIRGPPIFSEPMQFRTGPQAPHPPHQSFMPDGRPMDNSMFEHRISYNFDPLWVEDPLNESNNVGRNAFRYLQVQRAFSDAHRALVAALEWEVLSMNDPDHDPEYPLLKCLLQTEDLVFDL
jgi:hypothetical protein